MSLPVVNKNLILSEQGGDWHRTYCTVLHHY